MKKLLILLFILICTFSVAFAYSPNDILDDLTVLRDKGVISGLPTDYTSNPAWTMIIQKGDSINYYFIGITNSTTSYYPNRIVVGLLYTDSSGHTGNIVKNYTNSTSNGFYDYWYSYNGNVRYGSFDCAVFNLNGSNSVQGLLALDRTQWTYMYTNCDINTRSWSQEANTEYGGSYLLSSFEFIPTDTSGYINITANGVTESFIRRPFSYSVNNTRLGYISNPNDFYAIEGYLSYFIDLSGDSNVLDTIAGFTKNQTGTYYNNLFITSQGEVTIKTNKLLNMQGIALYFRYKEDANSSYEYSDEYYYYTYFYGTNPESGDLISPDLNSTADVGLVNALSDFFNTDSGESNVPYIINSVFPSGDVNFSGDFLPSGDIFGIPYVSYDNWGLGDFVVWTFKGFANAFTNYEDVTLNAGFLGNISTADFKLPQNAASSLIGFLANSFLLVRFLLWYWNLTITISTLDYEHLSGYEIDNNFFLF